MAQDKKKIPVFSNRRQAFLAIEDAGFKVSSAKFYRDCSSPGKADGIVRVNEDGTIDEAEVREYSKGLDRIEADIQDLEETRAQKARAELEKVQEQVAEIRFRNEKEQGKYVRKDEVDIRIISTLLVMEANVRQLIDFNLADICRILNGDLKKLNDAKDRMETLVDDMLNTMSRADSFSLETEEF